MPDPRRALDRVLVASILAGALLLASMLVRIAAVEPWTTPTPGASDHD